MRRSLGRSGVAAVEAALMAPLLITLMIASIDFGAAFLSKAQIAQALASAAEYATAAGQNQVANATIVTNATTYAKALTSSFLGTPTATVKINNGGVTGSICCVGSAWSCSASASASASFTCSDGSPPGNYITIQVSYPFKAYFSVDTRLTGKTLSDTIVARLQ